MLSKVWFFLVFLPFLIMSEAYKMFGKGLKSKNLWEKAPYVLVIALFVLLVALWLQGYRF